MRNKANFKIGKMDISKATIRTYGNEQRAINNERHSKQTQNEPNFKIGKMNLNSVKSMDYINKRDWTLDENKPKTNPISIHHPVNLGKKLMVSTPQYARRDTQYETIPPARYAIRNTRYEIQTQFKPKSNSRNSKKS